MKIYKILTVILFVIGLVLPSCGTTSVKDYIQEATDAMNEGDYTKAYSIVDQLMANKKQEYKSAGFELNSKIVNNEITSLFDNEDPFLSAKIIKILTERYNLNIEDDRHYDKEKLSQFNNSLTLAISLAFSINNLNLVEDLVTEYIRNNSKTSDFQYKSEIKNPFYTGILNKILNSNNENAGEIIRRIINTYPINETRQEGLLNVNFMHRHYVEDIKDYNEILNNLFNQALAYERLDIAKLLIELYKEDPKITEGGANGVKINGVEVGSIEVYIQYNWNSKNAAQKKLNETKKGK